MLITQFADQLTVLHDSYRDALRLCLKEIDPRIKNSHIACLKVILLHPGCTANDIVTAVSRDKSQVTRTLKVLLSHGWILKKANPGDGRSALLYLTAEGEKIGEVLTAACYTVAKQMNVGLNDEQLFSFLQLLDHMLSNLEHSSYKRIS